MPTAQKKFSYVLQEAERVVSDIDAASSTWKENCRGQSMGAPFIEQGRITRN